MVPAPPTRAGAARQPAEHRRGPAHHLRPPHRAVYRDRVYKMCYDFPSFFEKLRVGYRLAVSCM
jgi:hypothetical protein